MKLEDRISQLENKMRPKQEDEGKLINWDDLSPKEKQVLLDAEEILGGEEITPELFAKLTEDEREKIREAARILGRHKKEGIE